MSDQGVFFPPNFSPQRSAFEREGEGEGMTVGDRKNKKRKWLFKVNKQCVCKCGAKWRAAKKAHVFSGKKKNDNGKLKICFLHFFTAAERTHLHTISITQTHTLQYTHSTPSHKYRSKKSKATGTNFQEQEKNTMTTPLHLSLAAASLEEEYQTGTVLRERE